VLELIRAASSSIYFTGGEPFARKDLPALLRRSRELGFWPIFANTNLASSKLSEEAIRDIDVLIVSLGSTDEARALSPSGAVALDDPIDLPEHVAVGQAALSEISYPWEQLLPGWEIEFLPGQDGLFGLTLVPEQRIEIYVRSEQAPRMVAHVVAHELGHAIDVSLNDGADRRRWSELRGLDAPWWPESGATDFSTGAGDFAESFAAWQVGPAGFRSTLADPPDGAEIELLAELSAS